MAFSHNCKLRSKLFNFKMLEIFWPTKTLQLNRATIYLELKYIWSEGFLHISANAKEKLHWLIEIKLNLYALILVSDEFAHQTSSWSVTFLVTTPLNQLQNIICVVSLLIVMQNIGLNLQYFPMSSFRVIFVNKIKTL